ncbi:MAG: GTP-binding protein [Prochloraceae cyanobacterium]|nr:GTP-binding protein [Prochloraceae cyanobacterium]
MSQLKPEELNNAIFCFDEIQEELNYEKARESLRQLVKKVDLTSAEISGLEPQIDRLAAMLDKLEGSVIEIAAFGMVGRGKSSLLNALIGQEVFETGALHGVTRTIEQSKWEISKEKIGAIDRVTVNSQLNCKVQLIDTPGIDEVDGETREAIARQVARQVDLILFIIAGDLTKVEYDVLSELREFGKPILLVFNKIDQYPEADRLAIYEKIKNERVKQLISPEEIVMVAASPLETRGMRKANGGVKIERRRGKPQIEALKLKILDILHREGKSLVALNTMLFAAEVNEKAIQRKMEIRDRAASELIKKAVTIKALAIALNPLTTIDFFSGGAIDIALVLSLSRLYGIPMTKTAAIGLVQKIALSIGGISASEILAYFGLSSLKTILGFAAPISGGISLVPYISVAVTQGAVAGLFSYAIGEVTKTYLANGASWGEEGPKTTIENILSSLDETSILSRIKSELRAKLTEKYF